MNMATDMESFERRIQIQPRQDGFDDVRQEYSQMLRQQLERGNNGLTKTKYLTFGIEAESMKQAKPRLEARLFKIFCNCASVSVISKNNLLILCFPPTLLTFEFDTLELTQGCRPLKLQFPMFPETLSVPLPPHGMFLHSPQLVPLHLPKWIPILS